MSAVIITRKDHILWAEINRRERHNAIDMAVITGLEEILDEIESDSNTRVFVLSGSGNEHFVSGGDLKDFSRLKTADDGKAMARRMTDVLTRVETGKFWSIACVNGDAYGGGCEMILAFDFCIARKTAMFGFTQGRFNLPPGWGGLTRLVERVGRSRTLEWYGSCAKVPADVALNAGLVNRLSITSDLEQNTWDWAYQLSEIKPDLAACLKSGSRLALEAARRESLETELQEFGRFWEHEDHQKSVADFLSRTS